jgi:hypothetical protein
VLGRRSVPLEGAFCCGADGGCDCDGADEGGGAGEVFKLPCERSAGGRGQANEAANAELPGACPNPTGLRIVPWERAGESSSSWSSSSDIGAGLRTKS